MKVPVNPGKTFIFKRKEKKNSTLSRHMNFCDKETTFKHPCNFFITLKSTRN